MASNEGKTKIITNISQIADQYDGILLDQFGVIHDGAKPTKGAVHAVDKLLEGKRPIYILSNSTKRSGPTHAKLVRLGFPAEKFMGVLTAGEHGYHRIRDMAKSGKIGKKCLWFDRLYTDKSQNNFIEGMGLSIVSTAAEADFLLLKGMHVVAKGTDKEKVVKYDFEKCGEMKGILKEALLEASRLGLPLHCLNPDRVAIQPDGSFGYTQGSAALYYEKMLAAEGFDPVELVKYYGKPTKDAYDWCLEKMNLDPKRVLMIGDSLEHDIQGARNGGVDSLFIASGIHSGDVMENPVPVCAGIGALSGLSMLTMFRKRNSLSTLAIVGLASIVVATAGSILDSKIFRKKISLQSLKKAAEKFGGAQPTFVMENFQW
mmetsp:Transcript_3219/g.7511  ORF Transcript_3219/g.7511 Transcript_3219/m.7511 type:complete len:374 (-) Transcript_3219:245-1366(-)|eukprot:CAMPEP_0114486608 /NCGR_PEP_ID=MMETSP0109-20121206/305_1 /TAXON_ID=29199 /ORGANISM="Chlorarachnion reptans, Strain CCCM449" /LENGTH=373 /DNA_ID=CAMNT_0001662781 /DNA_START=172 /DNA_END=1293 /DNA_ORIENTATION=+